MKQHKYHFLIPIVMVLAFVLGSCSTNKHAYPVQKKRKKKKCDCPEWSYLQKPVTQTETLVLS